MLERFGNIWDHIDEYDAVVITTNGFVKKNGEAVMGRGIAKEAKERYPWFPASLGLWLLSAGNIPGIWTWEGNPKHILTMPVKPIHGPNGEPGWRVKAQPKLISMSARYVVQNVNDYEIKSVLMPRPGCGNGGLKWEEVKPIIEPILDDRFTVMTFLPL